MGKAKGKGKEIKVEQGKQEKKDAWKKVQAIGGTQGNDGKDFGQPYNGQDHECQCLVAMIKFNQNLNNS